MGNRRIVTTDRSGLSLAQVAGNDVYKLLPQVQSVIELGNLGNEYVKMFAEPVENGRSIDWYIDDGSNIAPLSSLDENQKNELLSRFGSMIGKLQDYAKSLRQKPGDTYRNYANILEKALIVPDTDTSLYSVDGQPVLVNWGFSKGDSEVVDAQSLMKDIQERLEKIKDLKDKIEEVAPAAAAEAGSQPETPSETPATEAPAQAAVESPANTAEQSQTVETPAQQPTPPAPKHSWLLPSLVGAALLAAGAAGMWYLLHKNPDPYADDSGQSMAWLKGDLNAKDVLIDENNEAVDLTLHFEGEDGRGKSIIKSSTQTCTGDVIARPQANNRVSFAMGELVCPNGNNYQAFTMVCERGQNICTGTNQNGENWSLKVNF